MSEVPLHAKQAPELQGPDESSGPDKWSRPDESSGPVQRFRGGLVFKAHRLLYHSTLGLRVIKKKKTRKIA